MKFKTFETCIVVATSGFVWVCQSAQEDENWLHLTNARCIRRWGTSRGLPQLVEGPTKETQMDELAPVVSITMLAVHTIIPSSTTGWQKTLGY